MNDENGKKEKNHREEELGDFVSVFESSNENINKTEMRLS